MLARKATEQRQEAPASEIFIKRDGLRFRYVLDYMTDDKVVLPLTESKEIILAELECYGIVVDVNNVKIPQPREDW